MLLDPRTTDLDVCLSEGADLHSTLMILMGQCISHLVGVQRGDECTFNLAHVTDDVIQDVREGFLKMGVHVQIADSDSEFRDPPNIRKSPMDERVSHISSKKIRFVFVSQAQSCGAQYYASHS